jgi:two-component system LytT family response regulator
MPPDRTFVHMNTQLKTNAQEEYGRVVQLRKSQVKTYTVSDKILLSGKLVLPTLKGFDCVSHRDIAYLKAQGNYTEVHTRNGKHLYSKTLKEIEGLLPPISFVRVHRSYVVNVAYIKSYDRSLGQSHLVLDNTHVIPVSRMTKCTM